MIMLYVYPVHTNGPVFLINSMFDKLVVSHNPELTPHAVGDSSCYLGGMAAEVNAWSCSEYY